MINNLHLIDGLSLDYTVLHPSNTNDQSNWLLVSEASCHTHMFQSAFIVAVVIVAGARSHHKQPYQGTARHGDPNPAGDPLSTTFSGLEWKPRHCIPEVSFSVKLVPARGRAKLLTPRLLRDRMTRSFGFGSPPKCTRPRFSGRLICISWQIACPWAGCRFP